MELFIAVCMIVSKRCQLLVTAKVVFSDGNRKTSKAINIVTINVLSKFSHYFSWYIVFLFEKKHWKCETSIFWFLLIFLSCFIIHLKTYCNTRIYISIRLFQKKNWIKFLIKKLNKAVINKMLTANKVWAPAKILFFHVPFTRWLLWNHFSLLYTEEIYKIC